ncbi:TPA: flippase [Pluralibacter gergoviae]
MSLIKNSIYNLLGFIVPTILAIPALGLLARQLGTENFGIFTLIFALIGYASIFDVGITRSVIREIAIHRGDSVEQHRIMSTASTIIFLLGVIVALVLICSTSAVTSILNVTAGNISEVNQAITVLALIIPVFLLNQVWLSYLEGEEQFANINLQKCISSSLLAILPTVFCFYNASLVYAVAGLALARVFSLIVTFIVSKDVILKLDIKIYRSTLIRLISFGGWMAISNIISPMMVYFDRFIISHVMGASKVAFYTAPSEGVTRLINIPYALSRALFPRLSNVVDKSEKKKLRRLSYLLISLVCIPLMIIGILFAKLILTTWMGPEYGGVAVSVMQVLMIGFYFNSIAQIPFSALQAEGRSKTTAMIHIAEVIPYLCLLFWFTHHMGVVGTAIAWSLRTMVDFFLLFFFSNKLIKY